MNTITDKVDGPAHIRAFIAIYTSAEIKQNLGRVQEQLQRVDGGVKWVAPENMHFTLTFLGDIPSGKVEPVALAMDTAAATAVPFSYDVSGLGYFGSRRSPKVIWAGISAPPTLAELHKTVCAGISGLDIPLEERAFKPHLTIGRVRSIRNVGPFMQKIESHADTPFGQVRVDSIFLVRSILTPAGPDYSTLHTACIGKAMEPGSR